MHIISREARYFLVVDKNSFSLRGIESPGLVRWCGMAATPKYIESGLEFFFKFSLLGMGWNHLGGDYDLFIMSIVL